MTGLENTGSLSYRRDHKILTDYYFFESRLMEMHQRIGWIKNSIRIVMPYPCMKQPQTKTGIAIPNITRTCKAFRSFIGCKLDRHRIFYRHQLKGATMILIIDEDL